MIRNSTAKQLSSVISEQGIFSTNDFSRAGYIDELLRFQKFAGEFVLEDERARINEVCAALTTMARKNYATETPEFAAGIRALKALEKEIAINMSGKNAEDNVAYSMSFATRKFFRNFRNVYVSDHQNESELDDVILTDSGIIVIEVKAARNDVTIAPDGRLMYGKGESFHNESIGDKMTIKCRLLKNRIEAKLRERRCNIPVHIDSYLVFDVHRNSDVVITDNYHQQDWCRRGKLQYLINDYVTDTGYSEEEFGILTEILNEMESNVRKYAVPLDLVSIRDQFIALYAVATEEPQKEAAVIKAPAAKRAERKAKADKDRKAKTWWMVAACASCFPLAAAACTVALKKTRVAP